MGEGTKDRGEREEGERKGSCLAPQKFLDPPMLSAYTVY